MSSILEILKKYGNKIDNLDLELIISRVIKKSREFVLAHPEHQLIKNCELKIKKYLSRRIKGEPLSYILGEKEFYGLNFKVNKNTLIPRPETELMVEEVINLITHNSQPVTLIDIGTGSGCIIITLAKKMLNNELGIMNYEFIGTDISESALKIARQNAKFHKVDKKIKFSRGNLLEPILKNKKLIIDNCKLIIVANLPYLTPSQIKNSPSIKYEPMVALDAGRDGLKYYRKLLKQTKKLLNMFRVSCSIFLEIDPGQTAKIKKIIKNNLPESKNHPVKSRLSGGSQGEFNGVKIKKDLKGLNRIAVVQLFKPPLN